MFSSKLAPARHDQTQLARSLGSIFLIFCFDKKLNIVIKCSYFLAGVAGRGNTGNDVGGLLVSLVLKIKLQFISKQQNFFSLVKTFCRGWWLFGGQES